MGVGPVLEAGAGRGGWMENDPVDELLHGCGCGGRDELMIARKKAGRINLSDDAGGRRGSMRRGSIGSPRTSVSMFAALTSQPYSDLPGARRRGSLMDLLMPPLSPHLEDDSLPPVATQLAEHCPCRCDDGGLILGAGRSRIATAELDAPDRKGTRTFYGGDPVVHPEEAYMGISHPLSHFQRDFAGRHVCGSQELDSEVAHRKRREKFFGIVRSGDFQATVDMIADGANALGRTIRGQTMLMLAATSKAEGTIACMEFVLELKCGIEDEDNDGWTPLLYACGSHNMTTVGFLLDRRAKIDHSMKSGVTPLVLAINENHLKLAKALHRAKASIDVQDTKGWTPLMFACEKASTDLVRWLLKHLADPSHRASDKSSPMILCSEHGSIEKAKHLLMNRADLDESVEDGETPLTMAIKVKQNEYANWLLDPWGSGDGASVFIPSPSSDELPFDLAHHNQMYILRDRIAKIRRLHLEKKARDQVKQKKAGHKRNSVASAGSVGDDLAFVM